jgi:hypothetical protein
MIAAFVFFYFVFAMTVTSFADQSLWPKNKGELCWDVCDIYGENCDSLVKLAVMKTVGNHYIVNGVNIEPDGPQLANGNAEIDGDLILINVSSAGLTPGSEVRGFMGLVVLDANTLDGTVEGIGINFDISGSTGGDFSYDGTQYLYYDPDCSPDFP